MSAPLILAFPPLAVRNYRLFAALNLFGNTATWMQRVALDWLILDASGDPFVVGFAILLQFGPFLLLGVVGGSMVDRFPRHTVLTITQACSAILALTLGVLVLASTSTVPVLLILCGASGLLTTVDNPARHAIVGDLVGGDLLASAISLNASIFQIGRLIGPALSGLALTTVGPGWSFMTNGAACAALSIGLCSLRVDELRNAPRPKTSRTLRDALRLVATTPPILWSIVLVGSVAVFALNLPVLLTSLARSRFEDGGMGYGLLTSCCAVGALAGAILSGRATRISLRLIVGLTMSLGVVQILVGLPAGQVTTAATLVVIGLLGQMFLTTSNALVQSSCDPLMRGRVMSVYLLVLLGGQAAGAPVVGAVTSLFGEGVAFLMSGCLPLFVGITTALARGGRFVRPPRGDD